jgi:hypothetical protein
MSVLSTVEVARLDRSPNFFLLILFAAPGRAKRRVALDRVYTSTGRVEHHTM